MGLRRSVLQVARYRERHGTSGAKSDAGMAGSAFLVLLDDRTAHTTFSLPWERQP
jgi:hypothetical protein